MASNGEQIACFGSNGGAIGAGIVRLEIGRRHVVCAGAQLQEGSWSFFGIGESEEAWHQRAQAMALNVERTLSFPTAIWLHSDLLETRRSPCYECCTFRAALRVMVRCVQV